MRKTAIQPNTNSKIITDDFQDVRLKEGNSLEWVVFDIPNYEKSETTVIVETNPLLEKDPTSGIREERSFIINKQAQEKINKLYLGVKSEFGEIRLETRHLH